MASTDVTVMGAGIFGLSIAWICARRGAAVRVIDPHGPGSGASGGVVGALAPHVPEKWNPKKAFQFESLLMAEAFWAGVEEVAGMAPGYGRTGRLQPIPDQDALELARQREASAKTHWQGRAVWRVRPVGMAGEWAPPSPTGYLIEDTLSARVDPGRACASLAAALEGREVPIENDGEPDGRVIWATGYQGLQHLSQELGRSVGGGVKGQAAMLRFEARDVPQIFAGGIHIVAHDNGTVALGSTSEREFASPDAVDDRLEAILARGTALMPALQDAPVLARWAGVRPRAANRSPMLGAWPGRADHFIANGGFKIGFGVAPKVAEVLADLVLEGRDTIPEGFRVENNL